MVSFNSQGFTVVHNDDCNIIAECQIIVPTKFYIIWKMRYSILYQPGYLDNSSSNNSNSNETNIN